MSTAQVAQASRAAANTVANQGEFYNAFDPSGLSALGLNVGPIIEDLRRIAGENQISSKDLVAGASYSNQNFTPYAENARWWGPEATKDNILNGYAALNPGFDPSKYINRGIYDAQQNQLGQQLMAQQQQDDGGFFGDLMSMFSDVAPILGIGSLLMGGFDFSSLLSSLGGEGLAAGGMSFAPEAFSSAFIPNASVAAGGMSGLPSFMSGLGAAGIPDMESMGIGDGGYNFEAGENGLTNPSGAGVTSAGGPLANGITGQMANFLQQNPWAGKLFSSVKGAAGNRQNPLMGALMGYGNSMMPGTGGPFSNALGMGSGVLSMFQGMDQNRRMKDIYGQVDRMGDPFAEMRSQAMSRLGALNSDPGGTLGNLPGYKAGMDAITRQRAAMGQLGSGNLATALLDYGGNIFNQERGAMMNQIAAAGDPNRNAMIKAQISSQMGAGNPAIMNGLSTLGFGLNRLGL